MKHYHLVLALPQLVFSLLDPAPASWDAYCFLKIHLTQFTVGGNFKPLKLKPEDKGHKKQEQEGKRLLFCFFCLFGFVVVFFVCFWMPPQSFLGKSRGQCLFYGWGLFHNLDYFHPILHHLSAQQLERSSSSPRAVGVHYRSVSLCLHISPSVSYLCAKQK